MYGDVSLKHLKKKWKIEDTIDGVVPVVSDRIEIQFQTNNETRWTLNNTGHFVPTSENNTGHFVPTSDSKMDLGSSSKKVRSAYSPFHSSTARWQMVENNFWTLVEYEDPVTGKPKA